MLLFFQKMFLLICCIFYPSLIVKIPFVCKSTKAIFYYPVFILCKKFSYVLFVQFHARSRKGNMYGSLRAPSFVISCLLRWRKMIWLKGNWILALHNVWMFFVRHRCLVNYFSSPVLNIAKCSSTTMKWKYDDNTRQWFNIARSKRSMANVFIRQCIVHHI